MMKVLKSIVLLTCWLMLVALQVSAQQDLYANLPFEMKKVTIPDFPERSVNVITIGAKGDGVTVNTFFINKAIEDVSKQGGGHVVIPRGIWLTGPITLKDNVDLHTEAGALIIFTKNMDDYPLVATSFEGLNTTRCMSPITGRGLTNVAITGEGVFDGSGDAWRQVKKSKLTADQWKKLVSSGGVLNEAGNTWYPTEKSRKGALLTANFNVPDLKTKEELESVKDFLRPVMVAIINCKNVLLDGPTFQNSPAWCVHPLMSEDVTIRNVTVRNPWYSQNGDGLDLESCKNVVIEHCSFDVGDDAICIKSGKDKEGRDRAMPTQNVIVNNCVVYHGHGGFVIGSEMSGGVKNIKVTNCTFIGTDVGLRFKSTRGRGGSVQNIYISNVDMIDIPAEAILFDLYYSGNSPMPTAEEKTQDKASLALQVPAVTEATPSFKDIFIDKVHCKGAGRAAFMQGLPEMNLKNIQMTDVLLVADKGIEIVDADGITMKGVSVLAKEGPAVECKNGKNILLSDFANHNGKLLFEGALTKNVLLIGIQPNPQNIVVSDNVKKTEVRAK